jgi:aminoglycoside 3-N-acetyltransferase
MSRSAKYVVAKLLPSRQEIFLQEVYSKLKKLPLYIYFRKYSFKIQKKIIKTFFSYTPLQLENKLREVGIKNGDTIFMHSSFNVLNGFDKGPQQLVSCLLNVIGSSGNLLMMSTAYRGSSYEYLKEGKSFDVKNTPSGMGVVTEIFRRQKNVLRSLNPVHPILAYGPKAEWIIANHNKTVFSCGKGSPFEKILGLNSKAFFFDVPFRVMTFYHYVEDLFKDKLTFHLYHKEPLEGIVYDEEGKEIRVKAYVFGKEARDNRSFRVHLNRLLEKELIRRNLIKTSKIGNTKLMLVDLREVIDCAQGMAKSGRLLSERVFP